MLLQPRLCYDHFDVSVLSSGTQCRQNATYTPVSHVTHDLGRLLPYCRILISSRPARQQLREDKVVDVLVGPVAHVRRNRVDGVEVESAPARARLKSVHANPPGWLFTYSWML